MNFYAKKALKKIVYVMAAVLLVFGSAVSSYAECVATVDGSGIQTQTLLAGQTINAGTVSLQVVGNNLEITYATIDGWELTETHLWIGSDLANMPQTRAGNPKIGNFPYNSGNIAGSTSYTVTIPLALLNFSCPSEDTNFYVAAHSALRKADGSGGYRTETGWADGDRFVQRGSWATFFAVTLSCDCGGGNGPEATCETAFAYGGNVANDFLAMDLDLDGRDDFNRWGWSNGPLSAGGYSFDIYAGAGQSDITKGTLVGTLTVIYDGSTAQVIYDLDSGFTMDEAHVYVGSEILARNVRGEFTVAPGQYPVVHDKLNGASSHIVTVEGLSGPIFVVAHAVVCSTDWPDDSGNTPNL